MKQLLCLLATFMTLIVSAQTSSEKNKLAGTWKPFSLYYDDYYSYDVEADKIETDEKLKAIMLQDAERYGKGFLESLREGASSYAGKSSLVINRNGTYTLTLGNNVESGTLEYLPLEIPISDATPESDRIYNEGHEEDFAYMKRKNGETITVTEYKDAFLCSVYIQFVNPFSNTFSVGIKFILIK